MSSLKDKVVVITGSSDGIGAATAVLFAREGCRLVLHGRNADKLKAVTEKCIGEGLKSDQIVSVTGDLNNDSAVDDIVKTTLDTFGTINVLFNNAGYIHHEEGPIHMGGTVTGLDDMYRINIRVPYMLVQAFEPELAKTKGVILNNSSCYAAITDPFMTSYCVMKSALNHLTRVMATSLSMKGIRVNSVNCGYVETDIIRKKLGAEAHDPYYAHQATLSPLEQKLAKAEDIANIAVFLASDKATAMTGSNVFCDRGATCTSMWYDFTKCA